MMDHRNTRTRPPLRRPARTRHRGRRGAGTDLPAPARKLGCGAGFRGRLGCVAGRRRRASRPAGPGGDPDGQRAFPQARHPSRFPAHGHLRGARRGANPRGGQPALVPGLVSPLTTYARVGQPLRPTTCGGHLAVGSKGQPADLISRPDRHRLSSPSAPAHLRASEDEPEIHSAPCVLVRSHRPKRRSHPVAARPRPTAGGALARGPQRAPTGPGAAARR